MAFTVARCGAEEQIKRCRRPICGLSDISHSETDQAPRPPIVRPLGVVTSQTESPSALIDGRHASWLVRSYTAGARPRPISRPLPASFASCFPPPLASRLVAPARSFWLPGSGSPSSLPSMEVLSRPKVFSRVSDTIDDAVSLHFPPSLGSQTRCIPESAPISDSVRTKTTPCAQFISGRYASRLRQAPVERSGLDSAARRVLPDALAEPFPLPFNHAAPAFRLDLLPRRTQIIQRGMVLRPVGVFSKRARSSRD